MAQPLRGAACRGAQHASNRLAPLQLPDRQHAGAAAAASLGPYLPGAAAPASQRGSMRAQSGALDTVQPLASRPAPAGVEDAIQGRFMLPAAEVKARLQASGLSLEEFLQSLITPAAQLARPPISNFKVGAVALAGSGNVYVGVNVEFRRGPLNNSIHAEQFLLVNCLHHGETSLSAVAVSAAPCGHCRQFMCELNCAESVRFMFGPDARPRSLGELLPMRFGPTDLVSNAPFPLLLDTQRHPVGYTRRAQEEQIARRSDDRLFMQAAALALDEAVTCYCPYTNSASGVAIITASGGVYSGGYIESAAYNPSMSPLHCALIDAISHHELADGGYEDVVEVVLAERPSALVLHKRSAQALLKAIAPRAKLTVLALQKVSSKWAEPQVQSAYG